MSWSSVQKRNRELDPSACKSNRTISLGRVYREKGYENMVVFEEELENYFDMFTDLAQSFPLFHGKRHEDEDLDEDKAVGFFKVKGAWLKCFGNI